MRHAHLRRSQTYARGGIHGFSHVFDQAPNRLVHSLYGARNRSKPWIGILEDLANSHNPNSLTPRFARGNWRTQSATSNGRASPRTTGIPGRESAFGLPQ